MAVERGHRNSILALTLNHGPKSYHIFTSFHYKKMWFRKWELFLMKIKSFSGSIAQKYANFTFSYYKSMYSSKFFREFLI